MTRIVVRVGMLLAVLSHVVAARADGASLEPQVPEEPKLTLRGAVERALATYPGLREKHALQEARAARVREAVARRLPQIAGRATITRFQEPMIVRPLHGFDIREPPDFSETLLQGNLTAQLPLFDGGERRARIAGERAARGAAEAATEQASSDLVALVTGRYLAVLGVARQKEAQAAAVRALEAESLRVEQHLREGRAARVQLLQVSAMLAQFRAEGVEIKTRLDLAERDLARALAADVAEVRAERLVEVTLADQAFEDRAAVLARLDGGNPQLRQAQLQLEAARWNQRAARSAWLPSVDVTAGYIGFGATGSDLTGEWQAAVRLAYPLFSGGARSARLTRAGWEVEAAEQRYRAARLRVEEAVDRALATALRSEAQVTALQAVVRHFTELARIEALRVAEGSGTEADYLDAESHLLRARAELIEARHQSIVARVEVARLTGRLSLEWVDQTLEAER